MRVALSFFVTLSLPFIGGRAPSVAIAKLGELNMALVVLLATLSGILVVLAVIGLCRLGRQMNSRRTPVANPGLVGRNLQRFGSWFNDRLPKTKKGASKTMWKLPFYPNGLLAAGVVIHRLDLPLRSAVPKAVGGNLASILLVYALASLSMYLLVAFWAYEPLKAGATKINKRMSQAKASAAATA